MSKELTLDTPHSHTVLVNLLHLDIFKVGGDVRVVVERALDFVNELRDGQAKFNSTACVLLLGDDAFTIILDLCNGETNVKMVLCIQHGLEVGVICSSDIT